MIIVFKSKIIKGYSKNEIDFFNSDTIRKTGNDKSAIILVVQAKAIPKLLNIILLKLGIFILVIFNLKKKSNFI